jgi:aspartate-semialdehyde dehydrogenase
MSKYNIAIVGGTGIVGLELLKVLEERKFPVNELRLFASAGSSGSSLKFKGSRFKVQELRRDGFKDIDIAFFAVDSRISKKCAPLAIQNRAIVIDKSNAFRMDKDVPLVVPEVNPDAIKRHKGIIASPNCSTIPLVMVLKPLHDYFRVKRVIVSTYQSVSGAGLKAIQQMEKQIKSKIPSSQFSIRNWYAFNAIPQIDSFGSDDYTAEESKMIRESLKILNDYSIKITTTCVRIPVYCGHSESVNIETDKPITVATVRRLLGKTKGIKVMDNPQEGIYPMPIDVAGKDDVYVGRIRKDPTVKNGINLWIVSDNLRKGAALNAVQIAESLIF